MTTSPPFVRIIDGLCAHRQRAEPPHVLVVTPRTGNHHPAWVGWFQRENQSLLPRRKRERISRRKMSPESGTSASSPSPSKERRALLAVETHTPPSTCTSWQTVHASGLQTVADIHQQRFTGCGRNSRAISKGLSRTNTWTLGYLFPRFRARRPDSGFATGRDWQRETRNAPWPSACRRLGIQPAENCRGGMASPVVLKQMRPE